MVLAGCLVDEETNQEFKKLGVRDSKQLTQKKREFLEKIIKEKAKMFEVVVIYPDEIDKTNKEGINLNDLEAVNCAKIINQINQGDKKIKVIIDCPSVSISKWKDFLKTKIDNLSNLDVICEHKADQNHVSVSAASILAKSVREREMDKLKKKYGSEIGSGYTSDPSTCKFLEKHAQKYKEDGIFRQTWTTWKNACAKREQKRLRF